MFNAEPVTEKEVKKSTVAVPIPPVEVVEIQRELAVSGAYALLKYVGRGRVAVERIVGVGAQPSSACVI